MDPRWFKGGLGITCLGADSGMSRVEVAGGVRVGERAGEGRKAGRGVRGTPGFWPGLRGGPAAEP